MTEKSYTEAMAEVGAQMARLEGKLDTGMAELTGAMNTLTKAVEAGNSARVAEAAGLRKDVDDHEGRIRTLENRSTVSPMTLWTVTAGFVGLVIAAASVVVNAVD